MKENQELFTDFYELTMAQAYPVEVSGELTRFQEKIERGQVDRAAAGLV